MLCSHLEPPNPPTPRHTSLQKYPILVRRATKARAIAEAEQTLVEARGINVWSITCHRHLARHTRAAVLVVMLVSNRSELLTLPALPVEIWMLVLTKLEPHDIGSVLW